MNVKFKMPKFGRALTGGSMAKELLLTTLATSISIVLTFGTAMWLEHRQKEKNRRQTAMMVISDIYAFQCDLQRYYDYFLKWKADIEELKTLSPDSIMRLNDEDLQRYMSAVATPMALRRDKTAENIFTSDISTWRDVGNYQFIRLVGRSYSTIADIEKNFRVKMDERGINNKNFETDHDTENMLEAEQLIAYMNQKEVKRCTDDFCNGFCPYIKESIDDVDRYIGACMELMSISNDELNEFIANSQ